MMSNDRNADIHEANEAFKGSAGLFSGASWELDSSELELNDQLGEGSFAKVFRGTYRAQEVAVKVLKEKTDKKALIEFEKEFVIMRCVHCRVVNKCLLFITYIFLRQMIVAQLDCPSILLLVYARGAR